MRRLLPLPILILLLAIAAAPLYTVAQREAGTGPITYRVTFPEPEHHWMQVDITFTAVAAGPFDARMSRSSPGRYAVAEFAKNVFSVDAYDGKGQNLDTSRPDADVWRVAGHDGTVRIVYRIFGDHPNGTFFGVDTTHAHLNMPAAFMWAKGYEERPIRITFTPPSGSSWEIATQLFPTSDPNTFTAPNHQYFMDSPTELSDFLTSAFTVPDRDGSLVNIRLVVHSDGSQSDVDALAGMVERLVREQMAVFGEFPEFETGQYTFLLDYVEWGEGDGMEHRNSTSISNPSISLRTPQGRQNALGTISHEFFHVWNVERIRPVGLEPFDFTRENVTCCLWLAEGFTQYYGPLLIQRAGLAGGRGGAPVNAALQVMNTPGRAVRSPVEMSEYAPFADGAGTFVDATDESRTFLSYYTYGAGLALALDLSMREISGGRLSLEDYMRVLWNEHGKTGGAQPGLVARPYSLQDLRNHLATVTGNRQFANDFFDRYVEGRESPDYVRLLSLAGYTVRTAESGRGWLGNVNVTATQDGLAVGVAGGRGGSRPALVPFDTPLYEAGIDFGDTIRTIDNQPATIAGWNAISAKRPGDRVMLGIVRRDGSLVTRPVTLQQDPTAIQIVPVDSPTPAQRAFQESWLESRVP